MNKEATQSLTTELNDLLQETGTDSNHVGGAGPSAQAADNGSLSSETIGTLARSEEGSGEGSEPVVEAVEEWEAGAAGAAGGGEDGDGDGAGGVPPRMGSGRPSTGRSISTNSVWKLDTEEVEAGKETERKVYFGMGEKALEKNLQRTKDLRNTKNNKIKTSKYHAATFPFVNLFEQFQRIANTYFLFLVILMLIPMIPEALPVYTMLSPLVLVLTITMMKDANDDWKRHKNDRQVNSRMTQSRALSKEWKDVQWKELLIGDVIRLKKNEAVPADIVLLVTSEEGGIAYIETADLDGETNLKTRHVEPTLQDRISSQSDIDDLLTNSQGYVRCDAPNTNLERFNGAVYIGDDPALNTSIRSNLTVPGSSLNNENTVLRGCIIRNTEYVVGLVVYVGNDTKMMKNTGKPRFKRTKVDKHLDQTVIGVFCVLMLTCSAAAIMCYLFIQDGPGLAFRNSYNWLYRADDGVFEKELGRRIENSGVIAFLHFFSYIIVMNTIIPISLYICVETIRVGQSMMIEWDDDMVDPATGNGTLARTTSINEELGQIDHVFTDKTGTLTQNVMIFRRCSIGGIIYGDAMATKREGHENNDKMIGPELQARIDSGAADVEAFFTVMAICHGATIDTDGDRIEYASESPDEKSLLDACRAAGWKYVGSNGNKMSLENPKQATVTYTVLDTIKFTSTRKRMSIVCRCPDGVIRMFSKGADNIMLPRIQREAVGAKTKEAENLDKFAHEGLRTLVIAQKVLSEEEYNAWHNDYHEASLAVFERETKMDAVGDVMEQNLEIVGCSGIEDKLQDGVPETIVALQQAGIKVWVLTGDKPETAINIGASCGLLQREMAPTFRLFGTSVEAVVAQLEQTEIDMNRRVADAPKGQPPPFALVVTGQTLALLLPPDGKEMDEIGSDGELVWTGDKILERTTREETFVRVAVRCSAVICCRVSPLQKSKVVNVVKRRQKSITLAIGDGANDVSMIRAAHIGIGISGLEGRQAVLASDFAFGQFRFLRRLLFVHGRWSYYRMSRFLRYFFYKSFTFTVAAQFFYAFYNLASAQTTVDAITLSMYNVLYSAFPVIVNGLIEQDVPAEVSLKYPILYGAGPNEQYFSGRITFMKDLSRGLLHAICCFFFLVFALSNGGGYDASGRDQADTATFSAEISLTIVVMVNVQLALDTKHFTWPNLASLLLGPFAWLVVFGVLQGCNDDCLGEDQFVYSFHGALWARVFDEEHANGDFAYEEPGQGGSLLRKPQYWLTLLLVMVGGCFPIVYGQLYREHFHPKPVDIIRRATKEELAGMLTPPVGLNV